MAILERINSFQLPLEEQNLNVQCFDIIDAIDIGAVTPTFAISVNLPVTVEVGIGYCVVFQASLLGTHIKNHLWIAKQFRAMKLKPQSTLCEILKSEKKSINWFTENSLCARDFAINKGDLSPIIKKDRFVGTLLIRGVLLVKELSIGVDILIEFLARKGEFL